MATVILKPDAASAYWDVIREAAACLAAGGLVVFPTETVYGIGACATEPKALARLRSVKGRQETKPFTVHIGCRTALEQYVPDPGEMGRRLSQKAWPGPLTLVFQVDDPTQAPVIRESGIEHVGALYYQGTIGIRYPDDHTAADLLTEVRGAVVAASANSAGATPAVDAEQALRALDGKVDLLIDAGRTRYGTASTIVRVTEIGYAVLREGVLDERTVRRLARVTFLVVCSGNTCRSAMGEGLLRRLLATRLGCKDAQLGDRGYAVESAGTMAFDGAPASSAAVEALRARGIDISGHRSTALAPDLIHRADYVFAMTDGHLRSIITMVPSAQDRCRRLDDDNIEDPIGGDAEVYSRCADRLEGALRRQLEEIPL